MMLVYAPLIATWYPSTCWIPLISSTSWYEYPILAAILCPALPAMKDTFLSCGVMVLFGLFT